MQDYSIETLFYCITLWQIFKSGAFLWIQFKVEDINTNESETQ